MLPGRRERGQRPLDTTPAGEDGDAADRASAGYHPSWRPLDTTPAGEAGDAADRAWLPYMLRWINSGGIKVIFDRDEEDRAREEAEEARRKGGAADHGGGEGGEGGEGEGEEEAEEEEEEEEQEQDQEQEVSGYKQDAGEPGGLYTAVPVGSTSSKQHEP